MYIRILTKNSKIYLILVQNSVADENFQDRAQTKVQYRIFIKLCDLLKKTEYLTGLELKNKNNGSIGNKEVRKLQEMLQESAKSVEIISSFSLFYEKNDDFQVLEKNEEFFQPFLSKDLESLQSLFITRLNELEN